MAQICASSISNTGSPSNIQQWLTKNINKKVEKCILPNGTILLDKTSMTSISTTSPKIVYPDTSKMVIYDPKHTPDFSKISRLTNFEMSSPQHVRERGSECSGTNAFDEILKATPPALVAFLANLPAVEAFVEKPTRMSFTYSLANMKSSSNAFQEFCNLELFILSLSIHSPTPNVDIVLSICLQSDLPTGQSAKTGIPPGKAGIQSQLPAGSAPATSELSGSSKSHPVPSGVSLKPGSNRQYGKRKESDKQVYPSSSIRLAASRRPLLVAAGRFGYCQSLLVVFVTISHSWPLPPSFAVVATRSPFRDIKRQWLHSRDELNNVVASLNCELGDNGGSDNRGGSYGDSCNGDIFGYSDGFGSIGGSTCRSSSGDRQEDDDTTTVQSQPLPRDAFRIRQYQKARASSASQTGSVSYGSAFSGDLSGSTG
ncbi:unnamed protein product [Sphenostylis stenocarpa]|uniref:Uncharacterized protein n=1 Tax=Sphenostylis stenocarpa TaxID=92480 RepID=A0AA86VAL1_9FABA|nr:unnamed protein product [Sphenostylis stenocarpa]